MIDRATDILGLVDVQPTFMPGGRTAGGRWRRRGAGDQSACLAGAFAHAFATQDWHPPGHASFASAHPGRQPYDTIEVPVRHAGAVAGPRDAGQRQRGACTRDLDLTRVEVIIRKGFHPAIDSYSTFFENDLSNRDRSRWLAAAAWLSPRIPCRARHRFLRRVVG